MPQPSDQLSTFRRLFLTHAPAHQAWMQPAGIASKYCKKFHPISDVELAAHLAGRLTIAAPLIGVDGQAHTAALDIDAGGDDALHALLATAQRRTLTAFAFTSQHAAHVGGHVWLLFDAPAVPERLRHLADTLAQEAGVDAERYPSGKTLRLPLGKHFHSGRRGRLLLPSGDIVDLDAGGAAITTALTLLAQLPRNRTAELPAVPVVVAKRPVQTRQHGPGAPRATIRAYNAVTDLVGLLEGYGGRIAAQYRSGRTLMHCPCGQHRNGDALASLEIQPARNPRYGRSVAIGYAPSCAFSLEQRVVVDAFAVYCFFEQFTPADAVRSLVGRVGAVAPPACAPSPAAAAGGGVQLALDVDGGAS